MLTYAAKTSTETSKTKGMLKGVERRALRCIKGVTLRDHIRSSETRKELNIQDVVRFARSRSRQWRDQVDRRWFREQKTPYYALT